MFSIIPDVSFPLILCIFNSWTQGKLSWRCILFQAVLNGKHPFLTAYQVNSDSILFHLTIQATYKNQNRCCSVCWWGYHSAPVHYDLEVLTQTTSYGNTPSPTSLPFAGSSSCVFFDEGLSGKSEVRILPSQILTCWKEANFWEKNPKWTGRASTS